MSDVAVQILCALLANESITGRVPPASERERLASESVKIAEALRVEIDKLSAPVETADLDPVPAAADPSPESGVI